VSGVLDSPRFVYFSWDGPATSVRWNRIGHRFDNQP
jgi:hypothetical protein